MTHTYNNKRSKKILAWIMVLTVMCLSCLLLWSIKPSHSELWMVYDPIITRPNQTEHSQVHKGVKEIEDILGKELKNVGRTYKNRMFNSNILYLKSHDPTIFDQLAAAVQSQTTHAFIRILYKDYTYENTTKLINAIKAIIWICLGLLILFFLLTSNLKYKMVIALISLTTLCLVLNENNRLNTQWQTQVETKVRNDLADLSYTPNRPSNKNTYSGRYGDHALKSLVGEVATEDLKQSGHRSSFRMRNPQDVFEKESSQLKEHSLWLRSTAPEKEIFASYVKSIKKVKGFISSVKDKEKSKLNLPAQSQIPKSPNDGEVNQNNGNNENNENNGDNEDK